MRHCPPGGKRLNAACHKPGTATTDRMDVRRGRPSKSEAEVLGEHVTRIAEALFVVHGFTGTSMTMVAENARIGKQTLYRRFPDKSALFREVIGRRIDAMLPPSTAGADIAPIDQLRKIGEVALAAVLDPSFVNLYRIVVGEASAFPELAASFCNQFVSVYVTRMTGVIQSAQTLGRCRQTAPHIVASSFLWALIGAPLLEGVAGLTSLTTRRNRDAHFEAVFGLFFE